MACRDCAASSTPARVRRAGVPKSVTTKVGPEPHHMHRRHRSGSTRLQPSPHTQRERSTNSPGVGQLVVVAVCLTMQLLGFYTVPVASQTACTDSPKVCSISLLPGALARPSVLTLGLQAETDTRDGRLLTACSMDHGCYTRCCFLTNR